MSNSALVVVSLAALFSASLALWTRTAATVDLHRVPPRYRRRVQWWQANAHHAQQLALSVGAAALALYAVATAMR